MVGNLTILFLCWLNDSVAGLKKMREIMTVAKIDENYVYLKPAFNESTCGTCAISGSCSLKTTKGELKIRKSAVEVSLVPGDSVLVDLRYNQAIISFIVYGLPLCGFVMGILLGYMLGFSDPISLLLGVGGLVIGFLETKVIDKRYEIKIIEKLPHAVHYNTNLP